MTQPQPFPISSQERIIVVSYGVVCHLSFVLAIGLMAYEVFWGFTRSVVPIGGEAGRWWNLLLLVQFPLLHSFLLSIHGKKILNALAPRRIATDLSTTTFATIAAWQLLVVFLFWTPAEPWFAPHGVFLIGWSIVYLCAWGLLIKAISDASLALHTGYLGWGALIRGQRPQYAKFSTRGLYSVIRQPIYLSFFLIILSGPVWSYDHLLLLMFWGSYCLIGPMLKERRFRGWYGATFETYREKVPYMMPRWW